MPSGYGLLLFQTIYAPIWKSNLVLFLPIFPLALAWFWFSLSLLDRYLSPRPLLLFYVLFSFQSSTDFQMNPYNTVNLWPPHLQTTLLRCFYFLYAFITFVLNRGNTRWPILDTGQSALDRLSLLQDDILQWSLFRQWNTTVISHGPQFHHR